MSWIPSPSTARTIFYGILIGFSLSITSTSLALLYRDRRKDKEEAQPGSRPIELRSDEVLDGVTGLIGTFVVFCTESLRASRNKRENQGILRWCGLTH